MPTDPIPGATRVQVIAIDNRGDERGMFCFAPQCAVDFLGDVKDVRAGICKAGALRGNNYNIANRQAVMVLHESEWTLFWDSGEATPACSRRFERAGAEVVLVSPGCARTIQNSGNRDVFLIELSNMPFRADDVRRRILCESK